MYRHGYRLHFPQTSLRAGCALQRVHCKCQIKIAKQVQFYGHLKSRYIRTIQLRLKNL